MKHLPKFWRKFRLKTDFLLKIETNVLLEPLKVVPDKIGHLGSILSKLRFQDKGCKDDILLYSTSGHFLNFRPDL